MAVELEPGDRFAGYRIEGLAGLGGMGLVYRATQLALDRAVALKLVAPALCDDSAFRARFQRESRLLALIDHPHVVPVYEAGEAHGQLFVSMRWVDGPDLGVLLQETAGLDTARALSIIGQVASALEATHAHGLVHRDVKPANILVECRDGADHTFLSDFGLGAHVADLHGTTVPGDCLGTLDYAAPEQLQGAPLSARADIYSLGCVLFELLTGRVPYPRPPAPLHDLPPSARELRPQLPEAIDEVIARAMATDPAERFPSAGAFALAAARAVPSPRRAKETLPPRSHPSQGAAPPVTPPRGRRLVLAASLAVAGLVVAAIALITSGGSPPAVACAPDGTRNHGNELFYCDFQQVGDGRTGGSPVLRTNGALVGYLHEGRNWVECQRPGRTVRFGQRSSHSWALTQSDHGTYDHGWGWVNAVYARAGVHDAPFARIPGCTPRDDSAYGQPPGSSRSGGSSP